MVPVDVLMKSPKISSPVHHSFPSSLELKAKLVFLASDCSCNLLCDLASKNSCEIVEGFFSGGFYEKVDVIAIQRIVIDLHLETLRNFN